MSETARKDRVLWAALAFGFVVRLAPMLAWLEKPCVRDECTYQDLARSILDGEGMVGTHGWLWAPAYPYLLAFHGWLTGHTATVQATQLVVATACIAMVYVLAERQGGRRVARVAAWLLAANPTHVFYTTSLWSETLYSGLLLAAMLALGWAREGGARRGWLPGLLVGLCVLFRGVATYILPIFLVVLLWERWRRPEAWRGAVACALAAVLAVAPYSVYATQKFGGLVVSDRTMGQMMWLGNNGFPPMTFDWGNGTLTDRQYNAAVKQGRKHCKHGKDPVQQDACETERGVEWIGEHPEAFVQRVPLRVAQLVNPHSFLTRHLRWGKWKGLPDAVDEALIVLVVAFSFVVVWGGTLGFAARARGWFALASGAVVLYHVAAIAVLAGLTRYRVPLEPLWTVWAALLVAEPRETMGALLSGKWRGVLGVFVLVVLLALMLYFLPAGWPSWRTW